MSGTKLIRDPAEWARDNGWVSGLRARRAAERLRRLGEIIAGQLGDDEGAQVWQRECEAIARYLEGKKA